MRAFILLFIGLIYSINIVSQSIQLSFDQINTSDGLEGKYHDFIYKDSRGYIWISSIVGLHRYDGIEMKLYAPTSPYGQNMIGSNIQSQCNEDKKGNIWFSTLEAIHCYHWQQDSISTYQIKDEKENEISHDYNTFFLERDTFLWTLANENIYTFNIHNKESKIITSTLGVRFAVHTNNAGEVKYIYACPWMKNSGIEMISVKEANSVHKKTLFNIINTFTKERIEVAGALIQSPECAWIFSDHGLIKHNPSSIDSHSQYKVPNHESTKVRDGILLPNNNLLLSIEDSGLWVFDTKKDSFSFNYKYEENNPNGLISDNIREVYLDYDNHLWVASKVSAEVGNSWLYNNSFDNPLSDYSPIINSITEDNEGTIWCSSVDNGIFSINNKGNVSKAIQYSVSNYDLQNSLPYAQHLRTDKKGNIWALSKKGFFEYSANKNKWQKRFETNSIRLNDIAFLADTLGIVTTSKGIFSFNPHDKNIKLQNRIYTETEYDLQVFNLFPSKSDLAYLPVKNNELWVYDYKIDTTYKIKTRTEIHCINDSGLDSLVWLGTADGLYLINKLNWKNSLKKIDSHEENFQILGIERDDDNNIWMSTHSGIWQYNVIEGKFQRYHTQSKDNIDNDHFNLLASYKSKDKIYFGTNNGLKVFFPSSINPYPIKPKVDIQSVKVNHNLYPYENISEPIEQIQLKHNQNNLDFKPKVMSLYLPKVNKVRYAIEGYQDEWETLPNGEQIKIRNLIPGNYNLKLLGINSNGISGQLRNIAISIAPPIWKRAWFVVMLISALIITTILIMQLYFKSKLKKQQAQYERRKKIDLAIQSERKRIASEMHDDLGGGLTSIQIWLNKLNTREFSDGTSKSLKRVNDKAVELVENMREIIWAMDSNHDNLIDLLAHIRTYFISFFHDHGIVCKANIPKDFPNIQVRGTIRRNVFLCVKESMHNILKHSKATEVKLIITIDKDLKIAISDNGIGIDNLKDQGGGYGLNNIAQRMSDIGGRLDINSISGTTIILNIPLSSNNPIFHE